MSDLVAACRLSAAGSGGQLKLPKVAGPTVVKALLPVLSLETNDRTAMLAALTKGIRRSKPGSAVYNAIREQPPNSVPQVVTLRFATFAQSAFDRFVLGWTIRSPVHLRVSQPAVAPAERVEEQLQRKPAGAAAAKAAVRAMLQSSEQLSSIVGRRVKIFWPGDGVWYTATVGGYDGASKHPLLALLVVCAALAELERGAVLAENSELHKIDYDDGEPSLFCSPAPESSCLMVVCLCRGDLPA